MKVKALHGEPNKGILFPCGGTVSETDGNTTVMKRTEFDWIEIKKGRYIHDGTSHSLRSGDDKFYRRVYGLEHENRCVYWFDTFAKHSSNHGHHVSFNWFEHQKFLWLQGDQWFQKEANLRYFVNVIFLGIGAYIGFKQIEATDNDKKTYPDEKAEHTIMLDSKTSTLKSNSLNLDSNTNKTK